MFPHRPDTVDNAIVQGDSLIGSMVDGNETQRFVGNVRGTQDSTEFWSDNALRYLDRDLIELWGRVLIVDGADSLSADTVLYNEQSKVGEATGSVRLSDGDIVSHAPSGVYYTQEKKADFLAGITLIDSNATITAATGSYFTSERRAELAGTVRLMEEHSYMEADSLSYLRDTEWSDARGNVVIRRSGEEGDSLDRTIIYAQSVVGTAERSQAHGFPLVVRLRQDSTSVDTLITRAQRLMMTENDSLQLLSSVGHALFWRPDVAAAADSMSYAQVNGSDREETWLFGAPIVWMDKTQLTGDTIRIVSRGQEVDTLHVLGNAFAARQDSITGRIHQVRGKRLLSKRTDDSTRAFIITDNAEVLYFRVDEEDQPDGAIVVSGDEAIMLVREGDAESLKFGEHLGTMYPEEALPETIDLEGFRWVPEQRPLRNQLLEGIVLIEEEH